MSGPKFATSTLRGGRSYKVPDGHGGTIDLPSVTTLLGIVAKPAITGWAAKAVAQYAIDNHDIITTMLGRGQTEDAIKLLKGSPWTTRDTAADVGSRVHKLIEAHILGEHPIPDERETPYWRSYLQFRADYPDLEFESSETTVYNLTVGYAGTMDAIATYQGRRGAFDWKTRQGKQVAGTSVYETELLQVVAYCHAEQWLLDDGTTGPFNPPDGASIVLFCEDGYKICSADLERDWAGFCHAAELYRWKKGLDDADH